MKMQPKTGCDGCVTDPEGRMLIDEILRTCANSQVANAAVLSLGGPFSSEIKRAADARDMTRGEFAAEAVEHFARHRDEAQTRAIVSVMAGSQQPVLDGLRGILSIALVVETKLSDEPERAPDRESFGARATPGIH